jgi:molecular chaperone GrpE
LVEGVEMTRRNLESALDRHGLTRIDPLDEKFDHNFHEAMFEVETNAKEPGTVVQVIQQGYRIHDRLLRPARVGIAKRPVGGDGIDTEA